MHVPVPLGVCICPASKPRSTATGVRSSRVASSPGVHRVALSWSGCISREVLERDEMLEAMGESRAANMGELRRMLCEAALELLQVRPCRSGQRGSRETPDFGAAPL